MKQHSAADLKAETTELLRQVRLIELQTARLVDQHLAGSYQSVFKGQGIAFAEVRAYEPGDDVRAIDWNVTARTGAPHIKQFTEERELTVMLLVDMSGSLDLGSRGLTKRQLVARLVATFAFSAIRNNDRVGVIGYTDEVELFVPPRSGRKHVLAVISRILGHQPSSRKTRHEVGLEYLARMGKGQAVVALISDFVDALPERGGGRFERALKLVRRRNDLIPVRVEDPMDVALPPLGIVAPEDLEMLGIVAPGAIDLNGRRVAKFQAEASHDRARFDGLMARLRLETMSVTCGESWQQPMVRFFERRARRMRR
ncbi:MAG: DUF58 domain-containing protein [Nannocystaceae bacterium]